MSFRLCSSVFAFSMLVAVVSAFAQAPAPPPAGSAPPVAPAAPAVAAPTATPATSIKVGGETKQTRGVVTDIDKGDNGCYVTFKNERGAEFIELGKFEICSQKPPLKGKHVELSYSVETIQAASCYGDPKCKQTETVPLIVAVRIVE